MSYSQIELNRVRREVEDDRIKFRRVNDELRRDNDKLGRDNDELRRVNDKLRRDNNRLGTDLRHAIDERENYVMVMLVVMLMEMAAILLLWAKILS